MLRISTVVLAAALMTPLTAVCADDPTTTAPASATTAPAATPAELAAATKEVKAAIDEAITLMDKKDYDAVFARFIPPDELKKIKENNDEYTQMKTKFIADKAADFSKALAECKAEEPTMESADKGTYKTTVGKELRMMKVDGKWYIN